jgi:Tfp pilus assembly protein PilP
VPAASVPTLEVPQPPKVHYEARGRRDPFVLPSARDQAPASPVTAARLTGIVRSANGTVLALVETPDGLGYILKPGDTLGDGRVVEISPTSVVFSLPRRPGATSNRVVLRLASDR